MLDMKTGYQKRKLPDQIRKKAEQIAHVSLRPVNVYYAKGKEKQWKDEAWTSGWDIYTSNDREDFLYHETAHIVQKLNGEVTGNAFLGKDKLNRNPQLERRASEMAVRMRQVKVQQNLEYPAATKAPVSVIQGNLGLEFQTVGGEWNVKQITRQLDGSYQYDGDLGHGHHLFDLNCGTHVCTDFKDLEYVTPAVLEIDQGRKNNTAKTLLHRYAQNAGNFHKNLKNKRIGDVIHDFTLCDLDMNEGGTIKQTRLFVDGTNGDQNRIVINPKGMKTAHPQATIGIKLESISSLIQLLRSNSRKKFEYTQGSTSSKINATNQRNTFERVVSSERTQGLSAPARGFIHLIQINVMQYIRKTDGVTKKWGSVDENLPPNAKSALPIMQRTSFMSIYRKLEASDREKILNELQRFNISKRFFGISISEGTLIAGQADIELTFSEWAASMVKAIREGGEDKLTTKDFDAVSKLYTGSPALADFGIADATDIGNGRTGAIIELRALERGVKTDQWGKVANSIFELVCYLNSVR